MKLLKMFAFVLTISLFFALVGCTNVELKIDSLKNTKQVNDTITEDKEDDIIAENKEEDMVNPNNLSYTVKRARFSHQLLFEGLTRIDTYEDYLKVYQSISILDYYNEEFFVTSSLILYGQIEGSGSNSVEITSVVLEDNNNITVTVTTSRPLIGTCDMAYYSYVIEYEKPEEEVKEINIKHRAIREDGINYVISDDNVSQAKEFIKENKDKIFDFSLTFIFDNKVVGDYKTFDYEAYSQQCIKKYGLNRIKGSMNNLSRSLMVMYSFDSTDDLDFNLLLEIANTDDKVKVILSFYYVVIENK